MVLDDFRRVHHHGRRCWADRRTLGTYRVVYRIDDTAHTVYVLSVRLRGDVYGVRYFSQGCWHAGVRPPVFPQLSVAMAMLVAYTVTATSYWNITWAGGGGAGVVPQQVAANTRIQVGEFQAIVTHSGS